MGDLADDYRLGAMCPDCSAYLGERVGHQRWCEGCDPAVDRMVSTWSKPAMDTLRQYLAGNAIQVQPGQLCDADMIFFGVTARNTATHEGLRAAIDGYVAEYPDLGILDLFDGKEHGYIEIGAWADDQGVALILMGLGYALGMWDLLTPRSVLRHFDDTPGTGSAKDTLVEKMAGMGYITIKAKKP